MLRFLHLIQDIPSLKQLPLKRYGIDFALGRLHLGVDNLHFDVHISHQVCVTVKRLAFLLCIKSAGVGNFYPEYQDQDCEKEKKNLRDSYREILLTGINLARAESEVQIDFLCQAALAKLLLAESLDAYRKLLQSLETLIITCEMSQKYDLFESFKMKEKLFEIKRDDVQIVRLVRKELLQVLADVQAGGLHSIRALNFDNQYLLPEHFFNNPALRSDRVGSDFLLVEDYVLFGQRADDPDNYDNLIAAINELLGRTDLADEMTAEKDAAGEDTTESSDQEELHEREGRYDPWLMEIDNIDLMFNYFDPEQQYQRAKAKGEERRRLREMNAEISVRYRLLHMFYKKFRQLKLMKLVLAAHEVKLVYSQFCPPLRPLQIREFLVDRGSRKNIVQDLKRRRSIQGTDASTLIAALYAAKRRMNRCSSSEKRRRLYSFIRYLAQYRRDLHNARLLAGCTDMISLVTDEKMLLLSRENHSLYEFLLPEERITQEKPIISHVIFKADIRGSMDITATLHDRGLNPASYFSLNFFDPISEILSEYGSTKEFIEGDAIILSICEQEDKPEGWYGVARACALAIRMLRITEQYNTRNQLNQLPMLEFGIGICYQKGPPTFLFDGDNRIMISPAINLADRLSSCDKMLRRHFKNEQSLFNLFVYQSVSEQELRLTADDVFQRYNVNGIELNPEGFLKLSREIKLTKVLFPVEGEESITLYAGKVPTLTGQFQPIVVREDAIVELKPGTMEAIGKSLRRYYEVCVHPSIYEYVASHT